MKKIIFLAFATALFAAVQANATIRRVGYFGTYTAIDYGDLQSAHDAAKNGDTIYLYPGTWNVNLSKKLNIIGYGYLLSGTGSNPGLQLITAGLSVQVSLFPGSDFSVFDGLDGFGIFNNQMGGTSTGIIIKHCTVGIWNAGIYPNVSSYPITNWQIQQSIINFLEIANGGSVNSLRVNNCIIGDFNTTGGVQPGNTGQFTNCVFDQSSSIYQLSNACDFGGGSFTLKNSIFIFYHQNDGNCVYQNCICNSDFTTIPSGSHNQNISFSATPVFNTGSTSGDGQYAITTGSPALKAGAGGVDCGIFGGTTPYVLSGLPSVPAFYQLTAPAAITAGNPYTITFSVQSY